MSALIEGRGLALPRRLCPTDFAMQAAELICLVGPNGSGKTSLLHALAGIGSPAGEVMIAGTDARMSAPAERQGLLSYLPATRQIAWPLTARDVILLGAHGRSEIPAALTAELSLAALLDRRVDRLSTGERSRVLLARALAGEPRLLLLDEPVANLDPLWQLRLMTLLTSLPARAQGVLVALHDLDLAARFADRLIVMNEGAIVADGDPAQLIGSGVIGEVFGIEKGAEGWRPLSRPEDR
jgi:iron complex transport system ATP-binding protein